MDFDAVYLNRVIQKEGWYVFNMHNILEKYFSIGPASVRSRDGALVVDKVLIAYMHTYHLHFTPEGVAEASQIFLRDAHVLPKLFSYE
jgi:hypothetical protein